MALSCNSIRAMAGNYPQQVIRPGHWVQEEGEGSYKRAEGSGKASSES